MKVKNLNYSSIKTKKLIKNTFAELLMEKKELNKITVKELTDKADINRGTFYLHYDNIYEVAEDFEEEILDTIGLDDIKLNTLKDVDDYFDSITSYLKKNEEVYHMLLGSKEPLIFLNKLGILINEKVYDNVLRNCKDIKKESLKFGISFFVDGIISQLLKYFSGNTEYSLDDINYYMKSYFKVLFLK